MWSNHGFAGPLHTTRFEKTNKLRVCRVKDDGMKTLYFILNVFNQEMPRLYKSDLAKTAAVAHYTKFQTIQRKTVTDDIKNIKKDHSMKKTKS